MVASYATRLFRLTLLAPNIVGAILNGDQPPELDSPKAHGRHAVANLIGTSSGRSSASPEASALFSQRIVRLCLVHSLFSFWLSCQKHGRSRVETSVPPKPENETRALFRSPHSRTDSSLAVQCQLRYTTKLRKSRVNSHYRNDKYTSNINSLKSWRREWDLNPRYGYPYNGFRVLRFLMSGRAGSG